MGEPYSVPSKTHHGSTFQAVRPLCRKELRGSGGDRSHRKAEDIDSSLGTIKIKNFKSTGLSIQRTLLHNLPRRGAFFYSYLRRQAPPSSSEPYDPSEPFY